MHKKRWIYDLDSFPRTIRYYHETDGWETYVLPKSLDLLTWEAGHHGILQVEDKFLSVHLNAMSVDLIFSVNPLFLKSSDEKMVLACLRLYNPVVLPDSQYRLTYAFQAPIEDVRWIWMATQWLAHDIYERFNDYWEARESYEFYEGVGKTRNTEDDDLFNHPIDWFLNDPF